MIIASFLRILYQEALGLLFFIQVQNVNDDSSSLCDVRCKAKGAEGFTRMVKAFHRVHGLWKVEVCHHQCFHIHSNSVVKQGRADENFLNVPDMPTECDRGNLCHSHIYM